MATQSTAPMSTTKASVEMRVIEMNPALDPRWEAFVLKHPDGSIYHHPAWLQALEREYRQKGDYLACEDMAGQLLSILPLMQTRGAPFNLGGPLTASRLASLPRTPLAGPLSINSTATIAVLEEAIKRIPQNVGTQLQIKTQKDELSGLVDGLICTPWRKAYLLQLPSEEPFRLSDSQERSKLRWALKKAAKSGVHARPAETEAELRAWYLLYLATMRRNIVPPRPYRFFAALWALLKPRGMMRLMLAEQQVAGRSRIMAGSIFLMFGRTVSYAFNGASVGDLSLRPNDLIQWEAINEACKDGFRFFDFGEVPEGNEDLARFKKKWGAEPVRLHRYYYPGTRDLNGPSLETASYPKRLTTALWQRLPLAVTAWLGDQLYAYL